MLSTARAVGVPNDFQFQKEHLEEIHRERTHLIEQIRTSQEAIERSQELIRRIDELLARSGHKP
jgi:hypothetical protein